MSTRHKNIKLFSWGENLLEIKPDRRKGCQFHLSENILQDILPPYSSKELFDYLLSLRQKISIEMLTVRYRSYFHKKIERSLCKANWSFISIGILRWIDRFSLEKTSGICWAHFSKQLLRRKRLKIAYYYLKRKCARPLWKVRN